VRTLPMEPMMVVGAMIIVAFWVALFAWRYATRPGRNLGDKG
jgi:hypothetical protein